MRGDGVAGGGRDQRRRRGAGRPSGAGRRGRARLHRRPRTAAGVGDRGREAARASSRRACRPAWSGSSPPGDVTEYPGKVRLIAVGLRRGRDRRQQRRGRHRPVRPRVPGPLQRGNLTDRRPRSGRVTRGAGRPVMIGADHRPVPHEGDAADADRTAVLPQQAALRRPGRLRPPPQPGAGRARPHRRGVLRPALPRPRRRRRGSPRSRASTSTASPTRSGCPRLREFRDLVDVARVPHHVHRRLPRAAQLQPPGRAAAGRAGRRLRRRPRQPDPRATACSTSSGPGSRWSRPSTTRSPSTDGSTSRRRRRGGSGWALRAAGTASCGCRRRVARRMPLVITPSEASRRDVVRDFGVDPARIRVILLGVDERLPAADRAAGARPDPGDGQRRRPDEGHRHPARGVRQAARRAGRPRAGAGDPPGRRRPDRAARRRSSASSDAVRFVHGLPDDELVGPDGLGRGRVRARRCTRASASRPPS